MSVPVGRNARSGAEWGQAKASGQREDEERVASRRQTYSQSTRSKEDHMVQELAPWKHPVAPRQALQVAAGSCSPSLPNHCAGWFAAYSLL